MTVSPTLPVSLVVNTSIVLSPTLAPTSNFGALLVVGYSDVIDTTERIRQYSTISGVAADFATTTPEYKAAQAFFAQSPQPSLVYIGRWAKTATSGRLHGGIFSAAAQATLLTALAAITTGSMSISVDGTAHSLTALNFSAVTTLNGAAAVIATALPSATVTWNSSYGRFEIESLTNGSTSAVSFATTGTGGVDVSSLLNLQSTEGGSSIAGIPLETPLACITLLASISNAWYGCMFAVVAQSDLQNSDYLAVAGFIEAASPSRIFGVTVTDANALNSTSTTDLAYLLSAANLTRTFTQYSSSNVNVIASFYGRAFTVNFYAQNSAITMKFKQEPTIVAENLNVAQSAALDAKFCNVFVAYDNSTVFVQQGWMVNGTFFDTRQGVDWQANDLQTSLFNLLYGSATKIPQTDAGAQQAVAVASQSMQRGVYNGLTAPGVWTSSTQFGSLQTGDTLANGYYVYIQPMAQQAQTQRAARILPPMQIAMKLAGAVHSASAIINVNS